MGESFDFIVIGGGSAGCVLAGRLSASTQHTVCLLEAGGDDRSAVLQCPGGLAALAKLPQFNWSLQTVPQAGLQGRRGYQPRGKALGGSSSVNAMIYLRGQPADYDAWAAAGNPGWSWDEVLPWFVHAENNARGADAYHGVGGPLHVSDLRQPHPLTLDFVQAGLEAGLTFNPDFNGPEQDGVGIYQVTQHAGERCSTAKAYLTPHLHQRNLQVRTRAQVLRILTAHTRHGLRAKGVEYLHHGVRHTVWARHEVLLSAGALLSPQVLMLSGIGPAAHLHANGVAPVHDVPGVGMHLHDHLDATIVCDTPTSSLSVGLSPEGVTRLLRGAWDWTWRRQGLLTTNYAEGGAFLRSRPDVAQPDLQLHFVVGKLVNHGRETVWGHGYSCHVCLLQPDSRGTVRLAGPDPLQAPLIDPNFLDNPRDLVRMVAGVQRMRVLLAQPSLARHGGQELPASAQARSPEAIADFVRAHADTIYHPVGSCRMGHGPLDVVDAQLQVHGVQGLRVVDASIFPRIISGNTNAPTVMVAERAAQWVLEAAQQRTAVA